MGRIILVCGGDKKVVQNYTSSSLTYLEAPPPSPFWLDLLSPTERLLHRISVPFRFHPQALKAGLSHCRAPGCEDFGHYLFIKTFLLEPSKKSLFIQADMKIFLSGQYLITIHRRNSPLHRLLLGSQGSEFTRTGRLLLKILDKSICTLIKSFPAEDDSDFVFTRGDSQPNRNPLWWRLRNFRAALLRHVKLLHELAFLGARFFDSEDINTLGSIKAKICFLSDITDGLLCRMDPSANVTLDGGKQRMS